MAEAPIRAPASRSDNLRTISCPSRVAVRPPWRRIDGFPILAELYVEFRYGISKALGRGARDPGLAHRTDRFTRKDGLTRRDADSAHPGQDDMIAIAGIQDQELSIRSEWPRIKN